MDLKNGSEKQIRPMTTAELIFYHSYLYLPIIGNCV